jgi:hypothetical protein
MFAGLPRSYGGACRLRTSLPITPPRVPGATCRLVFPALIAFLRRGAVEDVCLCSSQHESKCCESHYGKHELTHWSSPSVFSNPTRGCINFT